MTTIIILILVAMLLLAVELILLPGITVAAIAAIAACGYAIYKAFILYGTTGGLIVIGSIILLSIVTIAICLRAKTWRRLALNKNIDGVSQELPQDKNVKIGDRGIAITRLAPMGKVLIANETFEAKSIDKYIDQKKEVEVIGFENFNIIVKLAE